MAKEAKSTSFPLWCYGFADGSHSVLGRVGNNYLFQYVTSPFCGVYLFPLCHCDYVSSVALPLCDCSVAQSWPQGDWAVALWGEVSCSLVCGISGCVCEGDCGETAERRRGGLGNVAASLFNYFYGLSYIQSCPSILSKLLSRHCLISACVRCICTHV